MEHAVQVELLQKLMKQLDDGVNVDAGVMLKNKASAYTCPDMAKREWETFFRTHPQIIGLSGDLPEPGNFITVEDFGVPVLATRDKEGTFRAFHNACRHRGAMVTTEKRGKQAKFTCPFHGWTFGSDGALIAVPMEDHFGSIDKSCHGLIELPAVEKYGFLWVHPDPKGEIDAEALLGGLAPEFDSWGFDQMVNKDGATYAMDLNWKLAIDTFGETYHFKRLHKNTLAEGFYGDVQCYDIFERNHRMILCVKSIDDIRGTPTDNWKMSNGGFPVYYLFPNIQLNVGAAGMTMVRVYPDPKDPNRSISQVSFYFRPELLAAEPEKLMQIAHNFGRVIQGEDYAVAETTQRAAQAGLQDYVIYGRNEPALHHYHNTYRSALGLEPLEVFE